MRNELLEDYRRIKKSGVGTQATSRRAIGAEIQAIQRDCAELLGKKKGLHADGMRGAPINCSGLMRAERAWASPSSVSSSLFCGCYFLLPWRVELCVIWARMREKTPTFCIGDPGSQAGKESIPTF
jgi:hypothetical protein